MANEAYVKDVQFSRTAIVYSQQSGSTVTGVAKTTTKGTYLYRHTINGVKLPNWKSILKSGNDATTAVSVVHRLGDPPYVKAWEVVRYHSPTLPSNLVWHDTQLEGEVLDLYFPGVDPAPQATIDSVRNRVIAKYYAEYHKARSSIEGGQDLGEIRETIRMIRHPFQGIRDATIDYLTALKRVKNRYGRSPHAMTKHAAGAYLEYRFGVLPLAEDIQQLALDAHRGRWPRYNIDVRASEFYSASERRTSLAYGNFTASATIKALRRSSYGLRYRGQVFTNSSADGKISKLQALRLLPEDFVPTLWDLIPYSWMIDYFANIGEILDALSVGTANLAWLSINDRSLTDTIFGGYSQTAPQVDPALWVIDVSNWGILGSNSTLRDLKLNRYRANPSDLQPTFHFKVASSLRPWINMAALAVQRVSSFHLL